MDRRFRLPLSPVAPDASVLQGDRWRITVLTEALVRLEWAEDGVFEDRASTFALHRDLPIPGFRVVNGAEVLEIVTERLHLTYDRRRPSASAVPSAARRLSCSTSSRSGDCSCAGPAAKCGSLRRASAR